MSILALFFFFIAFFYSIAGFGGGSSYNALLILFQVDYRIYPVIALVCNMIVVTGGTWLFMRRGYFSARLFLPFALTSIPMAHIAGRLVISKAIFMSILAITLFVAGLRLLFIPNVHESIIPPDKNPKLLWWGLPFGAILGGLAGLVGIGGGIFLSPLLYFLRWGTARQIAATASGFILLNSVAGLTGQFVKLYNGPGFGTLAMYWPVFLAVFIGGQIGSRLSSTHIPGHLIRQFTAVLLLYVSIRIGWQFLN